MTARPAPMLTVPDARRRVEGHWRALTLACREAHEGAILDQLANFRTLVDAGALRVLAKDDPMAPLPSAISSGASETRSSSTRRA